MLCFINEIAKFEDNIIIHVSDKYNMNKYFIEYPKKQIYICFDGKDSFISLKLEHKSIECLFVQLVVGNNKIDNALKIIFKLKDENSDLYSRACMIIDQFNLDPKKNIKGNLSILYYPNKLKI